MKYNILSFSGGKDSTCLLLKMIDNNIKIDEVIFIDTTKDFEHIKKHIKDINNKILIPNNIKFTSLKIDFDYYFSEHIKTKGKNKGVKGYGFPFFRLRWCTGLKTSSINKYIKNIYGGLKNVNVFIGFNLNEVKRSIKFNKDIYKFLLIDLEISSKKALSICYKNGFNFYGIYNYFDRVSCFCCPLKSLKELRVLYNFFPNYWEKLKEMDKKAFNNFRADYTINQLEEKFKLENKNLNLFY